MADRNQMQAVLTELFRCRADLDTAALREILTEDVEHVMPRSFHPEPVVGQDAVAVGLTTGIDQYFDPASISREIVRTTIDGDVAAVEQRLTCLTKDGHPYHNTYVWIYEFRDGRIRRLVEHADTLLAARQFGLI